MTFTVNRSNLLTGAALKATGSNGVLFDGRTGLMCVLGQYLLTLGVSTQYLRNKSHVHEIAAVLPEEAAWLVDARRLDADSELADDIQETNDGNLHQTRRETRLAKLFATQGVNVVFDGRYADATRVAKRAYA